MSNQITLAAQAGRGTGSRESRRLRHQGSVPSIVYGKDLDSPIPIAVDHHDLMVALSTEAGTNALIALQLGDREILTMPRAVERHPYRDLIRHVDFVTVSLTETVRADVGVHLEGTPAGVEEGGVLSQIRASVQIESLATEIPSYIEVDVSHLELHDVLRVADLPDLPGVTYLDDPETVIASLSIPRAVVEEVPEEVEGEELAEGEAEVGEEGAAAEAVAVDESAEASG